MKHRIRTAGVLLLAISSSACIFGSRAGTDSDSGTSDEDAEISVDADRDMGVDDRPDSDVVEDMVTSDVPLPAPTVQILSPDQGEEGVSIDVAIEMEFSRPMNADLVTDPDRYQLEPLPDGPRVDGRVEYDDELRARFVPTGLGGALRADTEYRFSISDTLEALDGQTLQGPITGSFRTESFPVVEVSGPGNPSIELFDIASNANGRVAIWNENDGASCKTYWSHKAASAGNWAAPIELTEWDDSCDSVGTAVDAAAANNDFAIAWADDGGALLVMTVNGDFTTGTPADFRIEVTRDEHLALERTAGDGFVLAFSSSAGVEVVLGGSVWTGRTTVGSTPASQVAAAAHPDPPRVAWVSGNRMYYAEPDGFSIDTANVNVGVPLDGGVAISATGSDPLVLAASKSTGQLFAWTITDIAGSQSPPASTNAPAPTLHDAARRPSANTVGVLYTEGSGSGNGQLVFRQFSGSDWEATQTVMDLSSEFVVEARLGHTGLAYGALFNVFNQDEGTTTMYANGGAWGELTVLSEISPARDPEIHPAPSGKIAFSWASAVAGVPGMRAHDATWEPNMGGPNSSTLDLAFGEQAVTQMSYVAPGDDGLLVVYQQMREGSRRVLAREFRSGEWLDPVIVAENGSWPAAVWDPGSGTYRIVYTGIRGHYGQQFPDEYDVRPVLVTLDDRTVTEVAELPPAVPGSRIDVAFDGDGAIGIATSVFESHWQMAVWPPGQTPLETEFLDDAARTAQIEWIGSRFVMIGATTDAYRTFQATKPGGQWLFAEGPTLDQIPSANATFGSTSDGALLVNISAPDRVHAYELLSQNEDLQWTTDSPIEVDGCVDPALASTPQGAYSLAMVCNGAVEAWRRSPNGTWSDTEVADMAGPSELPAVEVVNGFVMLAFQSGNGQFTIDSSMPMWSAPRSYRNRPSNFGPNLVHDGTAFHVVWSEGLVPQVFARRQP